MSFKARGIRVMSICKEVEGPKASLDLELGTALQEVHEDGVKKHEAHVHLPESGDSTAVKPAELQDVELVRDALAL